MASSSYLKRKRSYDVFLSFRGTDVRNNFLSHLYTALDQNGLFAYIDSEELKKGEQISPALMKAIEESRVAITIFSKDYAYSPWCLEEVVKIMECKEQKDLVVLPVFYKVEPREVRRGRESYGRAMAEHESKFGKDSEKVKRWKEALFEAGSLSGWDLNDGDEAKLIKRIVEEISLQLDREPLHVAKYPVGMHLRVVKLKSMLNLEFEDGVLMIGLWGQGGIGKTTLAKALYNAIFRRFECSCFLANIREASRDSKDLVSLQENLLSDILVKKGYAVTSVDQGIKLMQYRLCHRKVLIVLDDVNDIEQLNALAGNCDWFGKGSRIIITTRDSHLLTSHGIDGDHIYEVHALKDCEALELFNKHAFARNNKIAIQRNLVDSALRYANGLPLALEVLGSFLCGRREDEWKSALSKLAKSPNEKINKILKLSYDGLEQNEKEIFLDIACFFNGRSKEYIMKVLDGCEFDPTIGVQVLVEKSLIFADKRCLWMHELIKMMGMDIVKQECLDDPEKRSRLWLYDDVHYVLSGDMGTNAVKAIVLDLPESKEIYIGLETFTNMRRLRVLIMINVHTSFPSPICLPNELRWFEWPECPWIPQFSSGPKKLVGLDMQRSNIQEVREQFKDFKQLKFLNFCECQWLVCMPNLECTPNLKELDLHGCKNLEHAHESIAYHKKLRLLNLNGCSKLQIFPDIPNENRSLEKLTLEETSIGELPASIENLVSLKYLKLNECKKLAFLPPNIYRLQNLIIFELDGCSKLIKFPKKEEDLSDPHPKMGFPMLEQLHLEQCHLLEVEFLENRTCFPHLQYLNLVGNNFTSLPSCEQLHDLLKLNVCDCNRLGQIPNIPRKLRKLEANGCKSLSKVPSNICDVDNIQLSSCHELIRNGFIMDYIFKLEQFHTKINHRVVLPGGKIPKWVLPNKEGYISFVASKGLYKKFIGLVVCVAFQVKGPKGWALFDFEASTSFTMYTSHRIFKSCNSDHVWLEYFDAMKLWKVDEFGPNDSSHFHFSITSDSHPQNGIIVKKCGFRLLCKPLEDNLEVLLQDDQSLDSVLLYEIWNKDSQMSTEEDSSSKLVHKEVNMADFSIEKHRYSNIDSNYQIVRPGGDMPKKFVLVEDDTISFMASEDLYRKFIGLIFCVVIGVEDGEKEISFDIVPHVNGQRRNVLSGTLSSFKSNHMWIQFLEPNVPWGVLQGGIDFDQFEESYLQFSLRVILSGGTLKKLGYVVRCWELEDDLRVVIEGNQLVDPAVLWESDYDTLWKDVFKGLDI